VSRADPSLNNSRRQALLRQGALRRGPDAGREIDRLKERSLDPAAGRLLDRLERSVAPADGVHDLTRRVGDSAQLLFMTGVSRTGGDDATTGIGG
jgi:hypothetical protein